MTRLILCANPKAQYLSSKAEIDAAIGRVLERGMYVLGEEVKALEREFANYVDGGEGIGVANGTDAIHLALRALGVGPGDEVITVSHTAVATVVGIELTGAAAVFVDIDPLTFTMNPECLQAAIGPRTKAIVVVHLYGHPADVVSIRAIADKRGLPLIEDCAQAHGAKFAGKPLGSFGDLACFSFYPTKNLGAIGDGGMVVTKDADLAARLRWIREYGWRERYVSAVCGLNSRLDELQAAVLRVKLKTLTDSNDARRAHAAVYNAELASLRGLTLPVERKDCHHVYHLYVVRSPDRDQLEKRLRSAGIGVMVHYPMPIHEQPAYVDRVRKADPLVETERAAREVLSLPMYPELSTSDRSRVIETLNEVVGA